MPTFKFTQGAAAPAVPGHGVRPIDEQARHYTVQCLQKIAALLQAEKITYVKTRDGYEPQAEPDTRLQFMAARFLLELGWGRSPLRPRDHVAGDELMTPEDQARLERFLDDYHHAKQRHATAHDNRTAAGGASPLSMATNGPPEPADPHGELAPMADFGGTRLG